MTEIKDRLRAILDEKPHTLSPFFKEEVNKLLAVDTLFNMQAGLQSLLRFFTYADVRTTKEDIIFCIQLILNSKQNNNS